MTDTTVDLLTELETVTSWLAANLLPGTHRPYRPELSADKKSELAAIARLKVRNDARSGMLVPLGETPAPADLEILDLLVEIIETVATFSLLPAPRSSLDDPRPHMRSIRRQLDARTLIVTGSLEDACETLIDRAHKVLGLVGDGQLLHAVCPWCSGITATHPEGGQRTLRIRAKLPPGKKSMVTVHPADVRWLVVCESGSCAPESKDCGTWWRGQPAWDLRTEADWLAKRLEREAS